MNCALSRVAGATTVRQAAPRHGTVIIAVAPRPFSMRSSKQLYRRRLGESTIVRNELNKWCVPVHVAVAGWDGSREGGSFWGREEEERFLSLAFARSFFEMLSCPLSLNLSLLPPLSCSLSRIHSRTYRANRDASDDIDGENEDDYSFDR